MNKTIYVRDEDMPVWDRARELAGDKLAPVIIAGLKQFIAENEAKAKGYERIVVSFNDSDDHWIPKRKAFVGRWIFPIDHPYRETDPEAGQRTSYAVAITPKNAWVVYSWEEDREGIGGYRFVVFSSAEEAAANKRVNNAICSALEKQGVPVEELDI